ncbi:Vacuolar protein sorting-associated protein 53 [Allomyces arbusculus]|nr:Vacuolar protein sorting-associated protein 53 [Allomyces arbusculus]
MTTAAPPVATGPAAADTAISTIRSSRRPSSPFSSVRSTNVDADPPSTPSTAAPQRPGSPTARGAPSAAGATVPFGQSPLDDKAFDPVSYVNQLFPNEASLASMDAVTAKLGRRLRAMDDAIAANLRSTSTGTAGASSEVAAVTRAMQQLCGHIVTIKDKSRDAERVVVGMTRDIKSLDAAKRNVTVAIAVTRRLAMLTAAVKQLRAHAAQREYTQISPMLQAINQLELHFRSYRNVPKVAALLSSLRVVQADLQKQILDLLDSSFTSQAQLQPGVNVEMLGQAAFVMDSLDDNARQQLQNWYCSLVLREYRTIFNGKDELSNLDNVPRRFAWLKRYLKVYDDDHARLFPAHWAMDHRVATQFADETRAGMALAAAGAPSKPLLKTVKAAVDMEQYLAQRHAEQPPVSLASAIEPFLGVYLDAEEKRVAEALGKAMARGLAPDEGNPAVLASATDLFLLYKELLATVAKLSRGKLVVDTAALMAKYLDRYAESLDAYVREEARGGAAAAARLGGVMVNSTAAAVSAVAAMAGSGASAGSGGVAGPGGAAGNATATVGTDAGGASSGGIRKDEWLGICRVLNTAQYCATITGQLQDKLIEKTVPPFQAQISLARQAEAFKATTMAAVKCLVRTLVDGPATDAAWTAMGRIAWGSLAMAGDRSEYVANIIRVLQEVVPVVFSGIAEQAMFKSFCDKVAEAMPNKFYSVMLKSKPVSEIGAEQLLMDAHVLRDACLKIPAWGDADAAPSSVFTKVLTKGFAKLDSLLKVLLTPGSAPPDALVTAFLSVYAPRDRTRANLTIVLDVRGTRRNDAAVALDMLATRLAAETAAAAGDAGDTGAGSGTTSPPLGGAAATAPRKIWHFHRASG